MPVEFEAHPVQPINQLRAAAIRCAQYQCESLSQLTCREAMWSSLYHAMRNSKQPTEDVIIIYCSSIFRQSSR